MVKLEGVDKLLRGIAAYRKRDPADSEAGKWWTCTNVPSKAAEAEAYDFELALGCLGQPYLTDFLCY